MVNLPNQKVLRIADKTGRDKTPEFITEDVVEVQRARLVYYKWVNRLMMLLATISLVYGVCATLAILKLVPQIMFDPQIFVQFSDSESLVTREYIHRRMASREKIMINFMKQYVELRNTYVRDETEMKKRWMWGGLVSYLSTYDVYQKFAESYPKVQKDLDQKKASRSVEILSVERSGGEKSHIWKVEFKTYDFTYGTDLDYNPNRDAGPEIIERFWTANIGSRADPRRRTAYKRLINPLGFVVYSYFQSEIEN